MPSRSALALSFLLAACGGKLDTAPTLGQTPAAPNPAVSTSAPYDIECDVFYRPATDDEKHVFVTRSDASETKTFEFPGLSIRGTIAQSESVKGEIAVGLTFVDLGIEQVYYLDADAPPPAGAAGGDGFTGIVYVGSDVQYVCRTPGAIGRREERPRGPGAIVCNVEVRAVTTGAFVSSQEVRLQGFGTNRIAVEGLDIALAYPRPLPEKTEGTFVTFDIWRDDTQLTRQMFQLGRQGVDNHLRRGFTATTTITANRANTVSAGCAALAR